MHTGFAIEGAVGSEYKVDALYLSADCQITHRLDQLCDVYDRMVIMSGDLQKMLSEKAKYFTRKIDTVMFEETKGEKKVRFISDNLGCVLR